MNSKKKTPRFYAAMAEAKTLIGVMQRLGRNATHVPGRKALNMCPDFLDQIDKPEFMFGITGTNGKTTVSNMIADVLQDNGYDLIDNRFGGNIDTGIVCSLVKNATAAGHLKKKLAVLEVDERMTPKIFPYLKPDILVVTNLFRDSYRRNAHPRFIAGILDKSIPETAKLILNAEDLMSNHLAPSNKRVYFGLDCMKDDSEAGQNIINDMRSCPVCGSPMEKEYIRYNHIGKAHCPNCGFGSPETDYAVTEIDLENDRMIVSTPKGEMNVKLPGHNITDAYNAVTAIAALSEFGLSNEAITASFEKLKIAKTRYNHNVVNGYAVECVVGKGQNPIACSRIFDYVRRQPGQKSVVLVIDDFYDRKDSSENIAWFFDTDFEFLNDPTIEQIVVGGLRCHDIHLRLLMAGVPEEKIICCDKDTEAADHVSIENKDAFYIVHDIYTTDYAYEIRDKIAERIEKGGFHHEEN